MKKRLIATLVLVASSSFAFAGNSERLIASLNLDETQSAEVQRILQDSKAQQKAIRADAKEQINAIKAAQQEELSAILDAEQMALVQTKMNNRKGQKNKKSHQE